jgi:GNAT superfamily N-acetyltransferase
MTDPHRLRRGTPADTRTAFDIFVPAMRDLTARQGQPWDPDPAALWPRMQPLLEHLAEHAAEWWIAEDPDGHPIGYARSMERGGLFELSEFFVLPGSQSAGVGTALLDRAFPADRGEVRAIIATTDVRAHSRYWRAGCAARFPIVELAGEPRLVDVPSGLEAERASDGDVAELCRIEAAVLEFDRGDEFAWLLGQREGYLYRREGMAVGFGFIGPGGSGPIASLEAADQAPILAHLEHRAAELRLPRFSLEVPTVNEVAVRHLLGRGFRMDSFFTFLMSSRPFGRFDRFIGFSPPFVL